MATSSLPQRPISSCSTSARLLPSDSAIFRVYVWELNQKPRGAIARTARALNCSDQHVSNVIRRHQRPTVQPAQPKPKEAIPEADPLTYVPAPGELEYMQDRAKLAAQIESDRLLASLLTAETPTETPSTPADNANDYVNFSSSAPFALALEPRSPTGERAQAPRYELAIAKRTGPTAEHQQALFVSRIAISVAALLTFGVLLLGYKSMLAGLGMLPAALVAWSIAAEGRRVARLG